MSDDEQTRLLTEIRDILREIRPVFVRRPPKRTRWQRLLLSIVFAVVLVGTPDLLLLDGI